jgi:alkanesulfonate monooxygenase SsuD/methylene tetrahydromethanopterin reductase-like flavin-dependent oxidoreductase (luciferase family)
MNLDIHVALPNGHRGVTLGQLTEITEVAEELGFRGVWPLDHVLVGPDLKDRATVEDFVPGMRTFAREVMPALR